MKKFDCPTCSSYDTPHVLLDWYATSKVQNEKIESFFLTYVCKKCGEQFYTIELEDDNYTRIYDAYRLRHGLLTQMQVDNIISCLKLSVDDLVVLMPDIDPNDIKRGMWGSIVGDEFYLRLKEIWQDHLDQKSRKKNNLFTKEETRIWLPKLLLRQLLEESKQKKF